ncbi:MAG: hypothetical protein ACYTEZ_14965 [Planctomycetota bacterium]|jgi:hypothetical protein
MRTIGLLAALLATGTGCSSLVAAVVPNHDLSVVRVGATREQVEDEIGNPKQAIALGRTTEAVYVVRVGRPRTPVQNALRVGEVGLDIVAQASYHDKSGFGFMVGAVIAVPAMIGTDLYLSVKELLSLGRRKRLLTVVYDARGRVASYDLATSPASRHDLRRLRASAPPAPRADGAPQQKALEQQWRQARGAWQRR